MSNKKICCLCGKEIEGSGNNPYPLMSVTEKCCSDCNIRYVVAAREIYFPNSYSDEYVLFNHMPDTENLMELLRSVNAIKQGSSWLTNTLAVAQQERENAEKSSEDSKETVDIAEE